MCEECILPACARSASFLRVRGVHPSCVCEECILPARARSASFLRVRGMYPSCVCEECILPARARSASFLRVRGVHPSCACEECILPARARSASFLRVRGVHPSAVFVVTTGLVFHYAVSNITSSSSVSATHALLRRPWGHHRVSYVTLHQPIQPSEKDADFHQELHEENNEFKTKLTTTLYLWRRTRRFPVEKESKMGKMGI